MDNSLSSFIDCLSVLKHGNFICRDDLGNYKITNKKEEGLKDKAIGELAEKCLMNLQKESIEISKRWLMMSQLKSGLHRYTKLSKETLSKGDRFIEFFSPSKTTIVLRKIIEKGNPTNRINQLNKEILELQSKGPTISEPIEEQTKPPSETLQVIDSIKSLIRSLNIPNFLEIENKRKEIILLEGLRETAGLFYGKVLDQPKYVVPQLQGMPRNSALDSIKNDFEVYIAHKLLQIKDQRLRNMVERHANHVIDELNFASEIGNLNLSGSEIEKEKRLSDCAEKIMEKMRRLPESPSEECVVIPGGYGKHTVIYKIKKEMGGKFSFTVINTGEDAPMFINDKNKYKVFDKTYTGVTQKQLSADFFKELMKFCSKVEKTKMRDVHQFIHKKLFNKKAANLVLERSYKAQKTGSCASQAPLSFLAGRLNKKLFKEFYADMSARGVSRAKSIDVRLLSLWAFDMDAERFKKIWDDALAKGERLAEKRKQCAEKSPGLD